MGRCGDVDDVHVRIMDQISPVMVSLEFCPESLLAFLDSVVQVLLVDVTDRHQTATLVTDKVEVAHSDSSDTDYASGHLIAGSHEFAGRIAHLAEHLAGKYRQGADTKSGFLDEISSGLCHN